jgi:hypothetical protein
MKLRLFLLVLLLAIAAPTPAQTRIKTTGIADEAVTTAKIADNAVTTGKVALDTLTASDLAPDSVGSSELQTDAVGSDEIDDGAVSAADLAATLDLSDKTLTLRGGWTYTAQTATTSGTAVELSTTIPTWATEIEVILAGVSTNTASQPPLVQLGDAGGYETASYVASAAVIEATNAGETDITAGFQTARAGEYAAADAMSGVVRLTRWDAAEFQWLAEGIITASGAELHFLSGSKTTSEVVTSIRLTTPGGAATFDAGEARVRYR